MFIFCYFSHVALILLLYVRLKCKCNSFQSYNLKQMYSAQIGIWMTFSQQHRFFNCPHFSQDSRSAGASVRQGHRGRSSRAQLQRGKWPVCKRMLQTQIVFGWWEKSLNDFKTRLICEFTQTAVQSVNGQRVPNISGTFTCFLIAVMQKSYLFLNGCLFKHFENTC